MAACSGGVWASATGFGDASTPLDAIAPDPKARREVWTLIAIMPVSDDLVGRIDAVTPGGKPRPINAKPCP